VLKGEKVEGVKKRNLGFELRERLGNEKEKKAVI
jgi:hypothetical protein